MVVVVVDCSNSKSSIATSSIVSVWVEEEIKCGWLFSCVRIQ